MATFEVILLNGESVQVESNYYYYDIKPEPQSFVIFCNNIKHAVPTLNTNSLDSIVAVFDPKNIAGVKFSK